MGPLPPGYFRQLRHFKRVQSGGRGEETGVKPEFG
jgi:hypothetical protein